MTIHLCEVKVRSTGKTIKYYEIESNLPDQTLNGVSTLFHIRERAADQFREDLKYIPTLRKLLPDPQDWVVDSVKLN